MFFLLNMLGGNLPSSITNLGNLAAIISALSVGIMVVGFIIGLALYLYNAAAWFTIAKKLGNKNAWFAWVPILNFFLYPMLVGYKWTWGLIMFIPIVILPLMFIPIFGFLLILASIFIMVMYFIWVWKIFEARKYPGWLSLVPLLSIIPIIGFLAGIAQLVIIGIVAWKDK